MNYPENRHLFFSIVLFLFSDDIEYGIEKMKQDINSVKKQHQTLRQELDDREKVLKLDLQELKNETGKITI